MIAIQASPVRARSPAVVIALILRALIVMEFGLIQNCCVVKVLPLPRRLPHLLLLDDVSDSLRLMDYVLIFNVYILHERPSYLLPEESILDWFMRFCPALAGVTKLPVFDGVVSVSMACEEFLVCLLACFKLIAAPAATFI